MSMAKRKISQWWFAGLAAMFPAGVLIPPSALALAARQGGDGVRDGYGRAMLALIVLGGLCALGSVVALLVAWCAAVLNARLLPDRRWYSALLLGGIAGILTTPLLGLGVLIFGSVMTAYLVAGPDGVAAQPSATIPTKRVITRWSGGGWGLAGIGLFVALLVPILTGRGLPLHGVLWPSLATTSAGYSVAVAGAIIVGAAWWAAIFNAHLLERQDLVPAAALDRSRRRPNHAPARLRGADLARVALCLCPAGAGRTDRRRSTDSRAHLDTDVTRAGGERTAHTAARSIAPGRHRPLPHLSAATATGANAGSRPARPRRHVQQRSSSANLLRGGYLLPQIFSCWAVSPAS